MEVLALAVTDVLALAPLDLSRSMHIIFDQQIETSRVSRGH